MQDKYSCQAGGDVCWHMIAESSSQSCFEEFGCLVTEALFLRMWQNILLPDDDHHTVRFLYWKMTSKKTQQLRWLNSLFILSHHRCKIAVHTYCCSGILNICTLKYWCLENLSYKPASRQ